MRATVHNARKGKNGTFSAKHNDRNFDTNEAEHIDPERETQNWYWQLYQSTQPMTFEDAERKFYNDTFTAALDAQNARHMERRQPSRVRDMEQYRQSYKTCPEETLYYIGSKKDGTVDRDTLLSVVIDQINWESQRFPAVQLLDVALHMDEGGAPHIHERKVWVAHDKDGNACVGQAAALAEMGIERPHPEKKTSRYNNAKQTYSAECREHFMQLCKEHGLEIIEQPQEKSKSGLEQDEYKAQQEQQRAAHAEEQARQAERQRQAAETATRQQQKAADKAKAERVKAEQDAQNARESVQKARERVSELQTRENTIDARIDAKKANLSRLDESEQRIRQGIDNAKEQRLDALRQRDAARADLDVTERLQELSGDMKAAEPPHVEILKQTEAKTSMFGKEIPATVTIRRDDFEDLRKKAGQIGLMQTLVEKLESSLDRMKTWARQAFTNKIDAREILTDAKVQEEAARADRAERQWGLWERQSKDKDAKISSLSADLDKARAANRDAAEMRQLFPQTFQKLDRQKRARAAEYAYDHMKHDTWGQAYCIFEGKDVNVKWLLRQYRDECRKNSISPREDMTDHLSRMEHDRGISR